MNAQILKKWMPILESIFSPYELENEILDMVAEYLERNLNNTTSGQYYSTLGGPGIGPVVVPTTVSGNVNPQEDVMEVLREFKERLAKDVDIRTDVKNVYYNGTIKRIVYELANGDSVYLEGKPLIMKDPKYVQKSKNLFLAISDPRNPKVRRMKIEDIKSNM
jgi:hypothetical protein